MIFVVGWMASYFRNDAWRDDHELKADLTKYIKQGIHRKEMIDFLKRDYPQYAWSIPTLDRRLRYFELYYTDKRVTIQEVRSAVTEEMKGPGRLLGYRAMHNKVRQMHGLNVPRDLVYAAMYEINPDGFKERAVNWCKKRRDQKVFCYQGTKLGSFS